MEELGFKWVKKDLLFLGVAFGLKLSFFELGLQFDKLNLLYSESLI